MNIYDFTVKNQEGKEVPLSDYKGKVLLVVNTATECGFTPQYEDLQKLYDKYHKDGFDILDFPCDQFGNQAPGSNEEIHTFCTSRYGITFPQFSKIDVNGPNAIPLYKWLEEQAPFKGFGKGAKAFSFAAAMKVANKDYDKNDDVKWNFTKILINKEGQVVGRFEPTMKMKNLEEDIQKELSAKS